jgi:hypothetical protein
MSGVSATLVLVRGLGVGGILLALTACSDDGGVAGSGTDGDEMPDDPNPGPMSRFYRLHAEATRRLVAAASHRHVDGLDRYS